MALEKSSMHEGSTKEVKWGLNLNLSMVALLRKGILLGDPLIPYQNEPIPITKKPDSTCIKGRLKEALHECPPAWPNDLNSFFQ